MLTAIATVLMIICITVVVGQQQSCNAAYSCISTLTQKECATNDGFLVLGERADCCPTCGTGLAYNSTACNNETVCAPGLQCLENRCILDKDLCTYTYHLPSLKELPSCEIDGTFTAKQCKGDRLYGRCFCYSEQGQRIFGFDWWKNADNMTCACSRQRASLEAQGIMSYIHCSPNGNYEPLQCDSGVCWCADPQTGRVVNNTRVVPDHLWKHLSCYNEVTMGAQYLRECESVAHAQYVKKKALNIRGTILSMSDIICDYDGRYGYLAVVEKIVASCTWVDGTRLSPYQAILSQANLMNCNCARDTKYFEAAGQEMQMICDSYGNYEPMQHSNRQSYCVDSDGYAVSDLFDTTTLDCKQFLYNEQQ